MKKKNRKEVFKLGSKTIDFNDLEHYEAILIAVVGILSIAAGTIYGTTLLS